MLMPKKVKYRKQQRGRMTGKAWRGSTLAFGDFGLKVLEPGWITDRQIEASRVAMTRFVKRGGKIWIRVFPDKPVTKKPAETRMGKGKGAPDHWVAVVRRERFCLRWKASRWRMRRKQCGWPRTSCRCARLWSSAKRRTRKGNFMKADKARNLTDAELQQQGQDLSDQLFKLRFQLNMGQTESLKKIRGLRKDIARVKTILGERSRSTATEKR